MPHSEYLIWVILNIIVGSAITSRSNIQEFWIYRDEFQGTLHDKAVGTQRSENVVHLRERLYHAVASECAGDRKSTRLNSSHNA